MIRGWFSKNISDYNDFVKALILGDLNAMNEYMNWGACETFSFFDTGKYITGKARWRRKGYRQSESESMDLRLRGRMC